MRLPRRRTLWLSAALVLVIGGVWFFAFFESRISHASFRRIYPGMSYEQVEAILGKGVETKDDTWFEDLVERTMMEWHEGPNWIRIRFVNGKAEYRELHVISAWETIIWYAKKGAAKFGVKWD
jgi:hypothetical protein